MLKEALRRRKHSDCRACFKYGLEEELFQKVSTDGQWKVLVLDGYAAKVVGSCLKMVDLSIYKIALVEDLMKSRESVTLPAVYFIAPVEVSIREVLKDLGDGCSRYTLGTHIFFTHCCPASLLQLLTVPSFSSKLLTLKEVDAAFIAVEEHAFELDAHSEDGLQLYWWSTWSNAQVGVIPSCKKWADQLATVCSTLQVHRPLLVRYQANSPPCAQFAATVVDMLSRAHGITTTATAADDNDMLLIVDRSVDPISPLLHELTLEALVRDVLSVDRHQICRCPVAQRADGDTAPTEVSLSDENRLWQEFKYNHIAEVAREIALRMKSMKAGANNVKSEHSSSLRALQRVVQSLPQEKRARRECVSLFYVTEECMRICASELSEVCAVEQDLVMSYSHTGYPVNNPLQLISTILMRSHLPHHCKLRLILLFTIIKAGLPEETISKLVNTAQLPAYHVEIIRNLAFWGVTSNTSGNAAAHCTLPFMSTQRRVKHSSHTASQYALSRWKPYLSDVIQTIIMQKELSSIEFPLLSFSGRGVNHGQGSASVNVGSWQGRRPRQCRKMIVFVVAGVCYSEIRAAAEIQSGLLAGKNWKVLVGGTHLLTPERMIYDLRSLSREVIFA